jgi:thiol-disulfide isomerase/thioredoxin
MSQHYCSQISKIRKSNHLILCLTALLFVAFVPQVCGNEENPSQDTGNFNSFEAKGNDKDISSEKDHRVIVYYFHGKSRCGTCKRIEQLTKEAVTESFANEIRAGLVELKVINVDEKENSHFSKDYQLYTRSVVVSDIVNGKEKQWKNLQKVWELVHNDEAFKKYIQDEIKAYLS